MSLLKNDVKEKLSIVILCAGEGTRLKEITKTIPKPLIKIKSLNNISILHHTINNLINFEIKQIAIIIGYLGNTIHEFISKLKKKHHILQDKMIIIDTENQYKLGSLYSFLSITKNKTFFMRSNYYLVIPGDTIFDYSILKEIISIIYKNYVLIHNYPLVFYRTIKLKPLKELYNSTRLISTAEVEKLASVSILKRISQVRIKSFPLKKCINQIIPVSVFNYDFIHEILNLKGEIPYKTVWESLNYMITNGKKVYAFEIENKHQFYDIDNKNDLKRLEKKKDNRCSD
ncbi:MAG: sugar phosphate nucleotidyltransferase [Promethearchaeota archaeon]